MWPISTQFLTCSSATPTGIMGNADGRYEGSICPVGPQCVKYPRVVNFDYL